MNDEKVTSAEAKLRGYDSDTIARIELDEEARSEALALIPRIESAFANIARPGITLHVARGYDDEWEISDERYLELTMMDAEVDWHDVSDEAIETYQEYFSFSDADGWLFYLPAFMCHYLRGFPNCGWDSVYYACEVPMHVNFLNEAQSQCVSEFLGLCHKWEEHYWPDSKCMNE
jgi:hypothetical protein